MQPNGPNLSIDLSSFATKLASPTALATNNQATGTIDHTNAAEKLGEFRDGHCAERRAT